MLGLSIILLYIFTLRITKAITGTSTLPDEGCKGGPVPGIKYVFGARGARGRVRAAEPRTHAAGAGGAGAPHPVSTPRPARRARCVRCASTTP